ncbi:hypothetical protein AV530_019737 [Patagioenas fasciata monilis]|uniref:Avidin n=1 Tax=Patagioenas fasciata monilis TaxID=372326 RepID=A0A1V4KXW5_PATFA|nr:hypothetical protein AV530_019737 [Patagioenas fasciata monilis]
MITAAQAASDFDITDQLTCVGDHHALYSIPSNTAVYYLSEKVILYALQESPGLPAAHPATFPADVGVAKDPPADRECVSVMPPVAECELTGEWVNDLGSYMTIGPVDKEGKFDGSYETAVKDTTSNIYCSPLVGFQHTCKENFAFGFTVNWKSSDPAINSITVFTGQCFVDDAGKETLKTMWLLRSGVGNIKDDWKATK